MAITSSLPCILLVPLCLLVDLTYAGKWKVFNETCPGDLPNKLSNNCSSLENVMTDCDADVHVDIKIRHLRLNTSLSFNNRSSILINGEQEMTVVHCMDASAGIVLNNISDTITINNLNLTSCALQVHHEKKTYVSALAIILCKNVEVKNVIIQNGTGLGLMLLNHLGGKVNIHSSSFLYRKSHEGPQMDIASVHRGGGVFIKLLQNEYPLMPMTFLFNRCRFENNAANSENCSHKYADYVGLSKKEYKQGGGAYVFVGSGVKNVNITFFDCGFLANQACLGAGLLVKLLGTEGKKTEHIRLEVSNSSFNKNVYGSFGSGANFILDADSDGSSISDSHFIIRNVNITENNAAYGGGVHYYSSKLAFSDSLIPNSILFDNCVFNSNQAHIGSAVILAPSVLFRTSVGRSVEPIFRNCQFFNNSVYGDYLQHLQLASYGTGTLYTSLYNIHFQGFVLFQSNTGTPIYDIDGTINFQKSDANFTENAGIHGGAIAHIGSSIMIVGPKRYEFINNRALYRGGALYILLTDMTASSCFIQYQDNDGKRLHTNWEAVINFEGNKARNNLSAGSTIYATSLFPCQLIITKSNDETESESEYTKVNISEIFSTRGKNITFEGKTKIDSSQVTTDAVFLNGTIDSPLLMVPGSKTYHGVQAFDEFNKNVSVPLEVTFDPEHEWSENITLEQGFVRNSILLTGQPVLNTTLILHTMFPRLVHFRLPVKLIDCPPGFVLNSIFECVCIEELQVGLTKCDKDNHRSYLSPGYWAGFNKKDNNTLVLVTSLCPFYRDYNHSTDSKLPGVWLTKSVSDSSDSLNKLVCGTNREGFACGICSNNYTVHFNSPGFLCKPVEPVGCKLGWLFYILSELVPVTVVFIFVLVLNISFTSGAVNGFILFIQLLFSFEITANGIIITQNETVKRFSKIYHIIYGLLNLEFFNLDPLSFCLWKNASTLDIVAFKYVTVLYVVVLIATVIWTMNSCGGRWLGKCCRISAVKTSVVHGISTFIVICYSQCVKVSLGLIIPLIIYVVDGSTSSPPSVRVWFNGELNYFGRHHLPYAIPALCFLLTIGLLPPALLLSYPLLNKVLTFLGLEDLKVVKAISKRLPVNYLKPLLDSFQGCFKDNFRFFAGLYFLYRWTFLITYMNVRDFSVYYPTINGILTVMLTLHTICQPYIKKEHNIIDALLFANLMIVNSLSFHNYHNSISRERDTDMAVAVQVIFIYLPLVVMSVYVLRLFYKYIGENCGCKFKSVTEKIVPTRAMRLRDLVVNVSAQNQDSDSSEEELCHDRYMNESVEYKEYF